MGVYKAEPELYCWFEFLNQGDLDEDLLGDKKSLFSKKEEAKSSNIPSLSYIKDSTQLETLHNNLGEIEKEIAKCTKMIKEGTANPYKFVFF